MAGPGLGRHLGVNSIRDNLIVKFHPTDGEIHRAGEDPVLPTEGLFVQVVMSNHEELVGRCETLQPS